MARTPTETLIRIIRLICLYLKNILVNSWRRLLMLIKYILLCWLQQKIRRAYRRLGEAIFNHLELGRPEPLVQADVKAQLNNLTNLKADKLIRRQGIRQLRNKIRNTSYSLEPHPGAEK
ncbi:MAG: hypothetical protein BZ151_00820 [Desulfobacca sp. 4484_104]|nr:MAG: hypothetical protein BZ151_00820 [Desulfobacca sp. 4484_104]RLA90689.1 MAG: hypothetical protein DRG58_01325 [Deltaproteobacteria bacterium]